MAHRSWRSSAGPWRLGGEWLGERKPPLTKEVSGTLSSPQEEGPAIKEKKLQPSAADELIKCHGRRSFRLKKLTSEGAEEEKQRRREGEALRQLPRRRVRGRTVLSAGDGDGNVCSRLEGDPSAKEAVTAGSKEVRLWRRPPRRVGGRSAGAVGRKEG